MEEGSSTESPGGEDDHEENQVIPRIITDEFYEELSAKANETMKNLQAEEQYSLAEDFQTMFVVSQNLRRSLIAEQAKNTEMKDEVAAAIGRVANALKISQTDSDTIEKLKLEINDAWKQTDAAQTREQVAQEAVYTLRQKVKKLEKDAEKFSDKKDTSEELGMTLAKHKEGILRERDRLNAEVEEMNRRLQIQRLYTDEMEKKRMETENKNKELYSLLDETSSEAFKEKRLLEQLQQQLADVTQENQKKIDEVKHYKTQSELYNKNNFQQNIQIVAVKTSLERISNQNALANAKVVKFATDVENLNALKEKLTIDLNTKTNLLKLKEDENYKLRLENQKLFKSKDILMKKYMLVDNAKALMDHEIIKYKNTIITFEKEREAAERSYQMNRKQMDALVRDRDLVRKDLMNANHTIGEQNNVILLQEQQIKTFENEIKSHIMTAQKQKSLMSKIEKERDRNAEEAQILADKVESVTEDLLSKQKQIILGKEKITELQIKLIHVQTLFETARSERNSFQRDLQSCIEDRDDLRERLRIATRQNEQLKEDIATNEAELLRANKTIEKLEKDKQTLKIEIQNTLVILQHTRTELKEKKNENERLYKTLSDDELRLVKLRKQLDNALNEKDLIGTQMIRRNDEISLLNDKLHIIQMALDRGESQYKKRLDDIRLLKIEIGNLRSQRNLLTRGLANTADMRQEVLQLNRILTQERVKAKALEQEMTTPMNVHRWRKLGGKDPDKLDLIFKIQVLQKRVLMQTVIATQRENTLQESHKLYLALKQFVLRLPSTKIKERLNSTQHALCVRTKKMKALAAELNAKAIDVKSNECTVEELKISLYDTKKELLKEKKEKSKLLEKNETLREHSEIVPTNNHGYRTLGAGFKVIAPCND